MADYELVAASNRSSSYARRLHKSPSPSSPSIAPSYTEKTASRSISPSFPAARIKKTVPNLRIGFRESDFDECRTERRDTYQPSPTRYPRPHWQLPSTREELIQQYSHRYRSPIPRSISPFRSYKLDAAELIVSRINKYKLKVMRMWMRKAEREGGEMMFRTAGRQMGGRGMQGRKSPAPGTSRVYTDNSLSFHLEDDDVIPFSLPLRRMPPSASSPFSLSANPRSLEEIETPKPFNLPHSHDFAFSDHPMHTQVSNCSVDSPKSAEQLCESMTETIKNAVFRVEKRVFTAIFANNRQKSAAEGLFWAIKRAFDKRISVFFAHELFLIPNSQYHSCKKMIIGVNCLVSALEKAICIGTCRLALGKLSENGRNQSISAGFRIVEGLARIRCRDQFNRLRFFGEILENIRLKESRRVYMRKTLSKLSNFVNYRLKENKQSFFVSLWRKARGTLPKQPIPSFSFPKSTKSPKLALETQSLMKNMIKIIEKHTEFRVKSGITVWKNAKNREKSYGNERIAKVLTEIPKKAQMRTVISIWKGKRLINWRYLACLFESKLKSVAIIRKIQAWSVLIPSFAPQAPPTSQSFLLTHTFHLLNTLQTRRISLLFHRLKAIKSRKTRYLRSSALLRLCLLLNIRRKQSIATAFTRIVL